MGRFGGLGGFLELHKRLALLAGEADLWVVRRGGLHEVADIRAGGGGGGHRRPSRREAALHRCGFNSVNCGDRRGALRVLDSREGREDSHIVRFVQLRARPAGRQREPPAGGEEHRAAVDGAAVPRTDADAAPVLVDDLPDDAVGGDGL